MRDNLNMRINRALHEMMDERFLSEAENANFILGDLHGIFGDLRAICNTSRSDHDISDLKGKIKREEGRIKSVINRIKRDVDEDAQEGLMELAEFAEETANFMLRKWIPVMSQFIAIGEKSIEYYDNAYKSIYPNSSGRSRNIRLF